MTALNALHLRAFHAVASTGSFTAAARRLHVTQPTVSAQVRSLERRHEVELFSRRGRSIALTPLGEELYAITRRRAELEGEAEQCLRAAGRLDGGHLRFGSDAPLHAMPVLGAFSSRHPQVGLGLEAGNHESVRRALLEHRVDVAVLSDVGDDHRLQVLPLLHDRLTALVPRRHRWARRGSLRAHELAEERLIVREVGSTTRRRLDAALASADVTAGETIEVDTREAVFAAVAAGLGVSAAAASEVPADAQLQRVPLDPSPEFSISLVCLAERRHARLHRAVFSCASGLVAG